MTVHFLYKKLGNSPKHLQYAWFSAMHTRVDMALYHASKELLKDTACQIYAEVARLEQTGSFYSAESELCAVNRHAAAKPVAISRDLYRMVELSLELHKKTLGCFDVTVNSGSYDSQTIAGVALEKEAQTIFYRRPDIKIDLSGFLKGYALEQARAILAKAGLKDALISMGGSSVLAIGNHPFGGGWKVDFRTAKNGDATAVRLHNRCLSTSGNEIPGQKHIISPHTGKYIEGIGRAAVVTETGTEGEALSTSLCVATARQREEILQRFKAEQILID
ncbi:MAG: FAD:protein FMN transferase [Prevotellaceae bacterium]|jgi:thiamine biosynthesis lipoprotein|nr:FAD:protein FMN transferase [Prevotellaceae bacterium]